MVGPCVSSVRALVSTHPAAAGWIFPWVEAVGDTEGTLETWTLVSPSAASYCCDTVPGINDGGEWFVWDYDSAAWDVQGGGTWRLLASWRGSCGTASTHCGKKLGQQVGVRPAGVGPS